MTGISDTAKAAFVRDFLRSPAVLEEKLRVLRAREETKRDGIYPSTSPEKIPSGGQPGDRTAAIAVQLADLSAEKQRTEETICALKRLVEALPALIDDREIREALFSADILREPPAKAAERLYMDDRTFYRRLKKGRLILYYYLTEGGVERS